MSAVNGLTVPVLVLAVALACHRRPARVAEPTRAAFLADTAVGVQGNADARELNTGRAAQRDSLRALLRRERALWNARKPTTYRFVSRISCFCPGQRGWVLIEVAGGEVTRATDQRNQPVPLTDWTVFTIDKLFDDLQRPDDRARSVGITFDKTWHFPAYVSTSVTPGPDMWSTYEVRGFRTN